MDERVRFIADVQGEFSTFAELCERYGVSRKTGYKWLARYGKEGASGLEEQSRRPHSCPRETPRQMVEALVEVRRRHPSWGSKKLLRILRQRQPDWDLPARSTCCDILRREGLVRTARRQRKPGHPGRPMSAMDEPNAVWTADFKGQLKCKKAVVPQARRLIRRQPQRLVSPYLTPSPDSGTVGCQERTGGCCHGEPRPGHKALPCSPMWPSGRAWRDVCIQAGGAEMP